MRNYNFYVYIVTNLSKTTLYVGVTNNMPVRLGQHHENKPDTNAFTGKYYCHYLIITNISPTLNMLLHERKKLRNGAEKNVALIESFNPEWRFLNKEIQA
jgi:putative endonuclease